ncbi:DsbA family protein [Vibrio sp. HN007]|uniref:DsbA family oxidoreductase n=1 Tax=Vibrio iocasae TaxID=3098914 RepID=UPI0035D4B33A
MNAKIEFFHDVVCGWCYIQSPALRRLASEYDVRVVHRNFVLQRNDREMINKWGSLENAKAEILQHWESCQSFEGNNEKFNISGMREADFNYPNGLLAAKATKAAEILHGQKGHWDMFDLLQKYHLQLTKNVNDIEVIQQAANDLEYDKQAFNQLLESEHVLSELTRDSEIAFKYCVRSIPTLIVNEKYAIRATTKYADLLNTLKKLEVL